MRSTAYYSTTGGRCRLLRSYELLCSLASTLLGLPTLSFPLTASKTVRQPMQLQQQRSRIAKLFCVNGGGFRLFLYSAGSSAHMFLVLGESPVIEKTHGEEVVCREHFVPDHERRARSVVLPVRHCTGCRLFRTGKPVVAAGSRSPKCTTPWTKRLPGCTRTTRRLHPDCQRSRVRVKNARVPVAAAVGGYGGGAVAVAAVVAATAVAAVAVAVSSGGGYGGR